MQEENDRINIDGFSLNPPQELKLTDTNGELIGTLYFENPMRFEGNVEESAKVFFNEVIKVTGVYHARN